MGSRRRRRKTAQIARNHDHGAPSSVHSSALEENVQAIKRWERTILLARSKAEQVSDWIACTAGSGPVLVLHVVWFSAWVTVNAGAVRGIRPFDPFPFPFLTMTVSLEAIFLALFVLVSQNRLTRQADKQSSRPADRFACRARDDGGAAVAPRHRPSPRGANQRDVRAVARLDQKDRPSTTHESVGGARGARHLSYTREVRGQSEGFESGILSACLQRN